VKKSAKHSESPDKTLKLMPPTKKKVKKEHIEVTDESQVSTPRSNNLKFGKKAWILEFQEQRQKESSETPKEDDDKEKEISKEKDKEKNNGKNKENEKEKETEKEDKEKEKESLHKLPVKKKNVR